MAVVNAYKLTSIVHATVKLDSIPIPYKNRVLPHINMKIFIDYCALCDWS